MKYLLILIFAAILIGSIILNVKQHRENKDQSLRIEMLDTQTSEGHSQIVERYVTKDSIQHVVIKELAVKSNAEKAIAVGSGYIDTITKALKISAERVTELTRINSNLEAAVKMLSKTDSSQGRNLVIKYFKDKYLDAEYNPESDSLKIKFNVALNAVKYWKRKNFLSEKQYYLDFFSDDNRVTINGIKRFTKADILAKRFSLGPNISYSYSPELNKWYATAGIGLQWNLIKF